MKKVNIIVVFCMLYFFATNATTQVLDVEDLSLDELLNVQISTAAKYEQKVSEAPASVTIITSENIFRYGYRTLDKVLMSIRGFYTWNDRNYTYVGVRGFSRPGDFNNRILVLLNGHTINENVYGAAFFGTDLGLFIDIIERIEIIRGPGSALYGTGAMFTVINIITKEGTMIDGIRLTLDVGSYGRFQGSGLIGKEIAKGMDVSISGLWGDIKGDNLYFEEFDDPETNHGIAENLDWDRYYGFQTMITYKDFSLQGIWTLREKGIPTAAWEMAFNNDTAKSLDKRSFIELKYDRDISNDKNIMLRGYYDHYTYEGTYPYEDIMWYDSDTGNWIGGELQFRWDLRSNNRLIIGTEYQNHIRADYKNWDEEEVYFDDNFPFNLFSFYLQNEYQVFKNASITLGIRRDEYSTVGSATTPRCAVILNPLKSSTVKLLYGQAFRAPNVYETHYEDPDLAKANLNIKPEKIGTSEIVWEQRLSNGLHGVVSVYNYRMKDLIDQYIDPVDSLTQFQNISQVKVNGLEFELNARTKKGFSGYVNYCFQNTKDVKSNEKLTNSPSHIFKFGFIHPFFHYFYCGGEIQYQTERITVYGTKTDPFVLTNMHFSSKTLFKHLRFSLRLRNIFDVDYKLPGGFEHIQHGIPQNSRNVTVKLDLIF